MRRHCLAEHAQSLASVGALNCSTEGLVVEESQEFRFADGSQDAIAFEHVREIHERPRNGGHWNPLRCGHIVWMKPPRPMDLHATYCPRRSGCRGDMNPPARSVIDPPQGCAIEVTQHRAGPTRHDGGDPACFACLLQVADRVDAAMDALKTTCRDAPRDRAPTDPYCNQLSMGDQPVLASGNPAEPPVRVWVS
jgi:hypothetical protein